MRLRHIKNAEELVYGIKYIINEQAVDEESANFLYAKKPLYIEIGMGKGDFIKDAARKNPDINFVGIEKFASIILKANVKVEKEEYNNLKFLCMDAKNLPELFSSVKKDAEPIKVDKIYLNFSDPWPKRKYEQRRLTSKTFLEIYKKILKQSADVEFKTDNKEFFDFSLKSFKDNGWVIEDLNYDIHEIGTLKERLASEGKTMDEYFATKLMTEYEKKFTKKGNKIGFLRARPGA